MVLRAGYWIWRNSFDDWSSKRRVGSVYYCEEVGFRISAIWRQTNHMCIASALWTRGTSV